MTSTMEAVMIYNIMLALLVIGFALLWTRPWGRQLFDVAVFIALLVLLVTAAGHLS